MNVEQILERAEDQLFEKEYEDVLRLADEVLEKDPHNASAGYLIARAHLAMGTDKDAESIDAISVYIRQRPGEWEPYFWRSVAYDNFGKHFGGTKPPPGFKTTFGQDPPYHEERIRAAIDDLTKAIEIAPNPKKQMLRRKRAAVMAHIGHEQAEAELEQLLRENPGERDFIVSLERIKRAKATLEPAK